MRGPSLCGGGAHAYYIKGESEERSERREISGRCERRTSERPGERGCMVRELSCANAKGHGPAATAAAAGRTSTSLMAGTLTRPFLR